jgi:hypothetical protein
MGKGDPAQTPYEWQAADYQHAVIGISVTFDNTTRALTGATVHRDEVCVYTRILIGLGPDNTPDTTEHAIDVPAGSTQLTAADLAAIGFTTIEQVLALQITAGR